MDKETGEYRFRLDCECGHCSLVVQHYPELIAIAEDDVLYIHHEISEWYADKGIWNMIKDRIVLAWSILMGRKYVLFDMGIRQHQLVEFRDYINRVILEMQLKEIK